MRVRHLLAAAAVASASALAACGSGGNGGSGAPVAPIVAPFIPSTGTISVGFSLSNTISFGGSPSAVARAPKYVSPGTRSFALYDGSTLIYVANYVPATQQITPVYAASGSSVVLSGACSGTATQTCTVTIQSTIGAHTVDLVTYPQSQSSANISTPPAFAGVILAEGEIAVTLVAGPNAAQTIAPLGVAARGFFVGPTLTQRLNGNGALVGIIGTSYTFQYAILDASTAPNGYQIVQPGDYDNGPVTIAETDGNNIVTMTPISQTTPPASSGLQSFSVTCQNNGTATITAAAKNKPNTTYASGLTYSATNYAISTLGTTTLQCVPNSATLPVTVQ